MYSSGDVVYIMAADAYIPIFGLSEGPLSYACFFSLHTHTHTHEYTIFSLIAIIITQSSVYIRIVYIYTYGNGDEFVVG